MTDCKTKPQSQFCTRVSNPKWKIWRLSMQTSKNPLQNWPLWTTDSNLRDWLWACCSLTILTGTPVLVALLSIVILIINFSMKQFLQRLLCISLNDSSLKREISMSVRYWTSLKFAKFNCPDVSWKAFNSDIIFSLAAYQKINTLQFFMEPGESEFFCSSLPPFLAASNEVPEWHRVAKGEATQTAGIIRKWNFYPKYTSGLYMSCCSSSEIIFATVPLFLFSYMYILSHKY